jgi:carboxypeptidase C (cathepsin A)
MAARDRRRSGCTWGDRAQARAHARRGRDARAALRARGQRCDLARPHRPRLHRPRGHGYSRPKKPELGKKFWGVEGDIQSVGEFIRLYLSRHERWTSPLFLVGESYGTTRAAGLSGHLVDRGIALNGIMLVSSVLNFQTNRFARGNDTPYPLYLPTYAATAWYHKKLPADLQSKPLRQFLDEVERWAAVDYPAALAKGDRLGGSERAAVADRLSRYTGLDKEYVEQSDLRIEIQHFCKELLRDKRRTVGRLDSRFEGSIRRRRRAAGLRPEHGRHPPPYTATFNDYVRRRSATRAISRITSWAAASGRRGTSGRGTATRTSANRCAARSRRTRPCGCSWRRATTTWPRRISRRTTR